MESAEDYRARTKSPKKQELPDIWSVVAYATKDRKRGCGCEALNLKVHRIYKKINPNYLNKMEAFLSCCGLCCDCHSDRINEINGHIDFEHNHTALKIHQTLRGDEY